MKEKEQFTVINNEGKEIVCDILFAFDSDETGKSYIAYTDNSFDEAGNVKVYASILDPNDESNLLPIESDKEWKVIEAILDTLQEEINGNLNSHNN